MSDVQLSVYQHIYLSADHHWSYTPRTKLKHYLFQYLSTISTSVQNFYHTEAKSWLILVLLNWKNPDWIFLRSCLELSFILRVYQSRWCAVFRHFHIFPFSPCKKRPQRIIDDSLTVVESFKKQLSIFMRGGVLLATLGDPTFTRMTWIWAYHNQVTKNDSLRYHTWE